MARAIKKATPSAPLYGPELKKRQTLDNVAEANGWTKGRFLGDVSYTRGPDRLIVRTIEGYPNWRIGEGNGISLPAGGDSRLIDWLENPCSCSRTERAIYTSDYRYMDLSPECPFHKQWAHLCERSWKLNAKQQEDVIVTQPFMGLCHMQVCAHKDVPLHIVESEANLQNEAGTSGGWHLIAEGFHDIKEGQAPVPCKDDPARIHYLLVC